MKRTNKYQLPYYQFGDLTTSDVEVQRWQSVDVQLYGLFNIIGNGILTGWELQAGEGLSVVITLGQGNVAFVACKTDSNSTLGNITASKRNYIYAQLRNDSYWTQNVNFGAFTSTTTSYGLLYLGYVDTDETSVTAVNMDNRSLLGFRDLIQQIVSEHKHIGGTLNPSPIDLNSEVQGIINQNNLPDMDASLIKTGIFNTQRIPKIDHETKVINKGTLTHNQLDSFAALLSFEDKKLMGEVSTINLLQLTLALKHAYPGIDDYLVNQISYIPGISPDDYVDWINTTAIVDTKTYAEGGTHTISGQPVNGMTLYSHVWNTKEAFSSDTYQNVLINGDSVILDTTTQALLLDNFSDLSQWVVETSDLSSVTATPIADSSTFVIGAQSAKVSIGTTQVEVSMELKKNFTAQDWSQYKYLVFYIKTESVQHGDIYFYFRDSKFGVQNSNVLVLPRNTPTVNIDTLQNGWQEITIDISTYERSSIDMMAFGLSTQNGWDTSIAFDFNIDNIYLQAGSIYLNNGYTRVIFGNDFFYRFWKVRWDAIIPTDSESSGIVLKSRARVANTTGGLPLAAWSDYTDVSGTELPFPSTTLYKYIEIEMYLEASTSLKRSPCVKNIYLDFYANASDNSFVFDTQGDWETGSRYNIDTETVPGSIQVSNIEDVGTYYYGADGKIGHVDGNLGDIYSIMGTSLPKTTYQVLNDVSPSLGFVTGVARGNNGNVWISDIDNDRVVEVDKYGNLVKGFYGSFLKAPQDLYGTEESGPGSNTDIATETTETSTTATSINVLHSIYNSSTGIIYVVFDSDLTNVYATSPKLNMNKIYVKIGSQKVYLNDSKVSLLGIDGDKYNAWIQISDETYSPFINQFVKKSHVLAITVEGAEKTFFDYMVDQKLPTITIASPNEQKMIDVSDLNVKFSLSNFSFNNGESIRVRIDGGAWQSIYTDNVSYSGLTSGKHTVDVQLVDSLSVPLTTIGAEASVSFVIMTSYNLPYLSIISPKQNQVYSSSPVMIEFSCVNFPVIPSGQHIRYSIDGGTSVDHYSLSPIQIDNIDSGVHEITLYTVDSKGIQLPFTYGEVTSTFIVGLNPYASIKLYVDFGAIYDTTDTIPVATSRTYIDIANVTFSNIYAPIDVQVIPYDLGGLGGGQPTVLVSKMRSPSWYSGLGTIDMALELITRIAKLLITTTGDQTITLNPDLAYITSNNDLVYLTKYLDGHSVVELDVNGTTCFSNNIAIFSDTKENAKTTLGSAEKIGVSELLIGDSINKRALITYTNLKTQIPIVEWEYLSDRFIVDFHASIEQKTISITNDAISETLSFIRQGNSVTWVNNSSVPISIYSGSTTKELFNADPDLNLYGQIFHSEVLGVGETYTYSFTDIGTYSWFTYPDILTAEISVSEYRLSTSDNFYALESDGKESPFSSRVVKIDRFGNVKWSFGESYLVKPRDIRVMSNGNILIST